MYVEVTWFGIIVFFAVLIIERRKGRKRDEESAYMNGCGKGERGSEEAGDETDAIDRDGYEWWNDPRWRE